MSETEFTDTTCKNLTLIQSAAVIICKLLRTENIDQDLDLFASRFRAEVLYKTNHLKCILENTEAFTCSVCEFLWNEPVTLTCGHTVCRFCAEDNKKCGECETPVSPHFINKASHNFLLMDIIEKCFKRKYKVNDYINYIRRYMKEGLMGEALKTSSDDKIIGQDDIRILLLRSEICFVTGDFEASLEHANTALSAYKRCHLGYYRRALALSALSKHDDAILSVLYCVIHKHKLLSSEHGLKVVLMNTFRDISSQLSSKSTNTADIVAAIRNSLPVTCKLWDEIESENHKVQSVSSMTSQSVDSVMQSNYFNETDSTVSSDKMADKSTLNSGDFCSVNNSITTSEDLSYENSELTSKAELNDALNDISKCDKANKHTEIDNGDCRVTHSSSPSSEALPVSSCIEDKHIVKLFDLHDFGYSKSVLSDIIKKYSRKNTPEGSVSNANHNISVRKLTPKTDTLVADDFECSLCSRLLLSPVTTQCGHTFCEECLRRSLDFRPTCPLCKDSLTEMLAEQRLVRSTAVEKIISEYFVKELEQRIQQNIEEASANLSGGDELGHIPVFVCTSAYPSVRCRLHIFEPRYRLMIRRCAESSSRQFGMCAPLDEQHEENFASYGTMLEILSVEYLPDGRSMVDTVGRRRFHVTSRGERDGYHTANVTLIQDNDQNLDDETGRLMVRVYSEIFLWFQSLPKSFRDTIVQNFGEFPSLPQEPYPSPNPNLHPDPDQNFNPNSSLNPDQNLNPNQNLNPVQNFNPDLSLNPNRNLNPDPSLNLDQNINPDPTLNPSSNPNPSFDPDNTNNGSINTTESWASSTDGPSFVWYAAAVLLPASEQEQMNFIAMTSLKDRLLLLRERVTSARSKSVTFLLYLAHVASRLGLKVSTLVSLIVVFVLAIVTRFI